MHLVAFLSRVIALDMPILGEFRASQPAADVTVTRAECPLPSGLQTRSETSATGHTFTIEESSDGIGYRVSNIGSFWIAADGRSVRYQLAPGAALTDVETMILGPVIGLALQLQGASLLHAGALTNGTCAFAVSGPHGTGKSTLVGSFCAEEGWAVLSDDILPLVERDGVVLAGASHPRMKLWDDSARALGLQPETLVPTLTGAPKRRVVAGRNLGTMATGEVPLAAVYLLNPSHDPATATSFVELRGADAVLGLLGAMYSPLTLRSGRRALQAFDAATRIAETVAVRQVSYCRSFENLPALREAILRQTLGPARA